MAMPRIRGIHLRSHSANGSSDSRLTLPKGASKRRSSSTRHEYQVAADQASTEAWKKNRCDPRCASCTVHSRSSRPCPVATRSTIPASVRTSGYTHSQQAAPKATSRMKTFCRLTSLG